MINDLTYLCVAAGYKFGPDRFSVEVSDYRSDTDNYSSEESISAALFLDGNYFDLILSNRKIQCSMACPYRESEFSYDEYCGKPHLVELLEWLEKMVETE